MIKVIEFWYKSFTALNKFYSIFIKYYKLIASSNLKII